VAGIPGLPHNYQSHRTLSLWWAISWTMQEILMFFFNISEKIWEWFPSFNILWSISFLRQIVEHRCFYHSEDQAWMKFERVQSVVSCPPARKLLPHRKKISLCMLLRHYLYSTDGGFYHTEDQAWVKFACVLPIDLVIIRMKPLSSR
jgi:hypothetical protein